MSEQYWQSERKRAIQLLRSGLNESQVSRQMGRSIGWVSKWKHRYQEQGWSGLKSQSRQPQSKPNSYGQAMRQMISQIRSELEAQAHQERGLCFVGAPTIRKHLSHRLPENSRIPSVSTIERILADGGMTRSKDSPQVQINYPDLRPQHAHQVHQLDIVPHHLPGGQSVACFNAIDVVSRYPTGDSKLRKSSQDAAQFLIQMWRDLGIARYTQMDNEACFSGGHTHPHVLGKVVRLCLMVGTQPVFIPIRHPKSNAIVERFHQTYNRHVWQRYYLEDLHAINRQAAGFFEDYRQQHYHQALQGQTPQMWHEALPQQHLPKDFVPDWKHLPITAGQIHFIRKVEDDHCIPILNVRWLLPDVEPDTGVWATLHIREAQKQALLSVYDAAPDVSLRRHLVQHRFPLPQAAVPLQAAFIKPSTHLHTIRPWLQKVSGLMQKVFTMF